MPIQEVTTTTTANPTNPIAAATGHGRRKAKLPLVRLLQARERLARLATEHTNHGLDDAAEIFALMIDVEDQIAGQFPRSHAALFPKWITTVSPADHRPGQHNDDCSLCQVRPGTDLNHAA